eukprot:GHVQ01011903.1.p1 GENE.GHVQ01011903.1~~GHVQ01011903.1.p1  ORF type:complete len:1012 (-),score=139.99 GHVQ01011903.1:373-3306(-)
MGYTSVPETDRAAPSEVGNVGRSRRRISSASGSGSGGPLMFPPGHDQKQKQSDGVLNLSYSTELTDRTCVPSNDQRMAMLDLLIPQKQLHLSEPSALSVRHSGWVVLRVLHYLTVLLRSAKPVSSFLIKSSERGDKDNASSIKLADNGFWYSQPFGGAIAATASELVCIISQWYLRSNVRTAHCLVSNSSLSCSVQSEDEPWLSAGLEAIVLQLCVGTYPLNTGAFAIPLMRHLLVLSHPKLQKSICNDEVLMDSQVIPIDEAIAGVSVQHTEGANYIVCRHRVSSSPAFVAPLVNLRNPLVVSQGDTKGNRETKWLFSGGTAGDPNGKQRAVADVQLCLKNDRSELKRQGYCKEYVISCEGNDPVELWVLRKTLVYCWPSRCLENSSLKESATRMQQRCWELFKVALWSLLVRSDTDDGSSEVSGRHGRHGILLNTAQDFDVRYSCKTELGLRDAQTTQEALINIVMAALAELTESPLTMTSDNDSAGQKSIGTFVAELLNLLHTCIKSSVPAAVLVLKSLMTGRHLQPSNLESMFGCPEVKSALYKLVTDCVRRAQSHTTVTATRTVGLRLERLNSSLLLQCLPPIVPMPYGGVRETAESYMEGADELVSSASSLDGSDELSRIDGGSGELVLADRSYSSVQPALPPVPVPPQYNPFDVLPQSNVFLCSMPSADFDAVTEGSLLRVTRAQSWGGVVLCRIPLTFPALDASSNLPTDILNFRLHTTGRFGVTVAPADCILRTTQEVFNRNDVVGFKTPSCPDFLQNVFAAECEYQMGDILDVKFSVDSQPTGEQQCLRTELMVSGVSIGSVLEVYFENRSQEDQQERMNLVFVFQDPMSILYEGPDFTINYVSPEPASDPESTMADDDSEGEDEETKLWRNTRPLFTDAVKLFQAILLSDNTMLAGLKDEVIAELCTHLRATSNVLRSTNCVLTDDCLSEALATTCKNGLASLAVLGWDVPSLTTPLKAHRSPVLG